MRKEAIKHSLIYSNWVSDFWTWFVRLASKGADIILFSSVLYAGYQLFPGAPQAPESVNAMIFIIQMGALDMGGLGLMKLAKQAKLPKDSLPMRVGYILIAIMIATVVLAVVKQIAPHAPGWIYPSCEAILLVARAIMCVIYGYAIHDLRHLEDTQQAQLQPDQLLALQEQFSQRLSQLTEGFTKREQQLLQKLDELTTTIAAKEQQFTTQLTTMQTAFEQQLTAFQPQQLEQQVHGEEERSDVNTEDNIVAIADYRLASTPPSTDQQQHRQQQSRRSSTPGATRSSTKSASPAKQKAQRILKRNPGLSAPELAKKVGISRQYASKLLAELA